MKNIAILGSTGSIGTQALAVVRAREEISVSALAAGANIRLLEAQIREFRPRMVSVGNREAADELIRNTRDITLDIRCGMEGLIAVAAQSEAEIVLSAVVGMVGIRPTIEAIRAGRTIALANKETLVCAGHIIMPLAERMGVSILPVDSEHSAIFQSLCGQRGNAIEKILLTASGGPFRGRKREDLINVGIEDALRHPNWSMGKKVTVDSATMVNKGLEMMEAGWLFGVKPEQIEVVVHPQSVIHSMVQFEDGAVIAQLGMPDMKLPIAYALSYPERRYMPGERLDFFKLRTLSFEKPDVETFTGLGLAMRAMREGGSLPAVFNAANEYAVALFLEGDIPFLEIPGLIGGAMDDMPHMDDPSVEDIMRIADDVDEWMYKAAGRRIDIDH